MANKKIRQLSNLNREMVDTDCIAVDTGSATGKMYPQNIKAGYIRDKYPNGTNKALKATYNGAYLSPDQDHPVYLAGMQRAADDSNIPVIGTVSAATVKTLLGVSTVTNADITQPDLTIGNNGWVELTKPASGTPMFAMAATWGTMTNGQTALAIAGFGSHWYLTGTPGVTVTGLVVRYIFVS